MGSRLTISGAVLFVAGILLLAYSLNRVVQRIRYRDTGDPLKRPPKSPSPSLIILALMIIACAQVFFWLSSQIQDFRPLNSGRLGQLEVERQGDPIKSLKMLYIPTSLDSVGEPNLFYLSGDSWRFSGEIIDFKFARKFFGLPERAYKTTVFDGRFLERLPPNISAALLHENTLEGGSSAAFRLFRDSKYFKWFATVDSFATDYVTTPHRDSYILKIAPDRTVDLQRIEATGGE
jgi:hypothetical protein